MTRPVTACGTLCAALLLALEVRAAPYTCPKSNYDVDLAVVYANGMFTDRDRAEADRDALRPLVASRLGHDPYAITMDLAYNDNEATLLQLWNVAKQRLVMTVSQFMRLWNGLNPAPDWFIEAMKAAAAEVDQIGFLNDRDLQSHVQTYRDHLRKGRRVVVVAHSQGNLYANAAYRELFETSSPTPGQRSFGIVGVATPAPTVAGWQPELCSIFGCYTTFLTDWIITGVRAVLPDTLPSNVTGLGQLPDGDPTWHGFREAYLHIDQSREQIVGQVQAFVDEFEELNWTVHDAMITASLEWDSDADLDLHVFEHDGRDHVYYAYPAGSAGYLDADDSDGQGPENYYADCGYVEAGSFRFAVGYYRGEGPVTARLRVQAGTLARSFTRVLAAPQAEASITDPETVAWLEVVPRDGDDYELLLSAEE